MNLCTLQNAVVTQDDAESVIDGIKTRVVSWTSHLDVDADGANGQTKDANGRPMFAYAPGDLGLDYLKNACYPNGAYRDILVCAGSRPLPFKSGSVSGFYSKTAWFDKHKTDFDPDRYLDSASVRYICVEGFIRRRAKGVVLGCAGRVTWRGKQFSVVVGDIEPLYKIGEGSIKLHKDLGSNWNPKNGGIETHDVFVEIFPDVPGLTDDGRKLDLISAV